MKKQSLATFNATWSEAVFAEAGAMHVNDFVNYANEYLFGEGCEGLYENISQCASEIAMYGDSGPGSMLVLREQIEDFNKIADRYTQLTGRDVQRPSLPYVPSSYDDCDPFDQYH